MGDTAEPSVARFDLLLAHADSVFCVLEPAGTLLFVSDSARRVLGVDAGDPTLATPCDPAGLVQNFLSYVRDNTCYVQASTDPVNVFNLQAYAAGYILPTPFGPDWQLKGTSRRRLGAGWPKRRGRKPVMS